MNNQVNFWVKARDTFFVVASLKQATSQQTWTQTWNGKPKKDQTKRDDLENQRWRRRRRRGGPEKRDFRAQLCCFSTSSRGLLRKLTSPLPMLRRALEKQIVYERSFICLTGIGRRPPPYFSSWQKLKEKDSTVKLILLLDRTGLLHYLLLVQIRPLTEVKSKCYKKAISKVGKTSPPAVSACDIISSAKNHPQSAVDVDIISSL